MTLNLPKPECEMGYPLAQVKNILGNNIDTFNKWMVGQTGAICNGKLYDRDLDKNVSSGCGPHGMIIYTHDLKEFIRFNGKVTTDW